MLKLSISCSTGALHNHINLFATFSELLLRSLGDPFSSLIFVRLRIDWDLVTLTKMKVDKSFEIM